MFHTNQYNASTGEKKWTKKGKQIKPDIDQNWNQQKAPHTLTS